MKAILVDETHQQIFVGDAPDPVPGEGDLLVSVRTTALNRADVLQRKGKFLLPRSLHDHWFGNAGVVEGVGSDVQGWKVGDRICALLPGGGYAQKAVIPAVWLSRITSPTKKPWPFRKCT